MNLIRNLNKIFNNNNKIVSTFYRNYSERGENNKMPKFQLEPIEDQRVFCDLKAKQFECLATNSEQMKNIESILANYEYLKYTTLEVPTTLTDSQMTTLLDMKSNDWNKYLVHLYRKELRTLSNQRIHGLRKVFKKLELTDKWKHSTNQRSGCLDRNGNLVYGLWHNSLSIRISPQNLRKYSLHKLRNASLFSPNIVFDLKCDRSMKSSECHSKVQQLVQSYRINRYKFKEPFNLNFCNLNKNSLFWEMTQKSEFFKFPYFVSEFTEKSYIDLFERKKLVYLTPNAKKSMDSYDSSNVYIISFNDGFDHKNYVSLLSRNEDIDIRKLPIDDHVFWSGYTKDLKSYTVLSILNDVKDGIDWKEAIERHVPKHYIKAPEVVEQEEANRLAKLTKNRNIFDMSF